MLRPRVLVTAAHPPPGACDRRGARRGRRSARHLQRRLRLRPLASDREPARRQRLVLPAERGAPASRRARARHVRQPREHLAGDLAAAAQRGLLRLRAQLRLLCRQRRARDLRHGRHPPVGRPARRVHRPRARGDRGERGRPGRALAGRDDAALVPRARGRGDGEGRHARRPAPPRTTARPRAALFVLSSFFPGADAFTGALCPALPAAEARLGVHGAAQRRRRHGRRGLATPSSRPATTRSSRPTRRRS